MQLEPAKKPPVRGAHLVALILAACFLVGALSICGSARTAHQAPPKSAPLTECLDMVVERDELANRIAELEAEAIAAELRRKDRCMTELAELSEPATARKQWPKVLSVFTSRDPNKPDKLAGKSSAWPLPFGNIDAESMASDRSTWKRRAVRPDDMAVALRGVRRYTKVRVCQDKRCVEAWTSTTGPWGARCSSPGDCADNRPCIRRATDPARPGDDREWWWTIQIDTDGPCVYRGLVDVTPAVCEAIDCTSMKPARYTVVQAHATSTPDYP